MKKTFIWILRITILISLIPFGYLFGRRFYQGPHTQHTKTSQRTLLIVIKKFGSRSEVQSAWLIGRSSNDSSILIQIFPNQGVFTNPNNYTLTVANQISERDFLNQFDLTGFVNWWQVRPHFFTFLQQQGIMWDVYYVIDQYMVDEISRLTRVDPIEQLLTERKTMQPEEVQSKLWKTICAHAVQLPDGLDLNTIPNKNGHYITDAQAGSLILFNASPSIATCGGSQSAHHVILEAINPLP